MYMYRVLSYNKYQHTSNTRGLENEQQHEQTENSPQLIRRDKVHTLERLNRIGHDREIGSLHLVRKFRTTGQCRRVAENGRSD